MTWAQKNSLCKQVVEQQDSSGKLRLSAEMQDQHNWAGSFVQAASPVASHSPHSPGVLVRRHVVARGALQPEAVHRLLERPREILPQRLQQATGSEAADHI